MKKALLVLASLAAVAFAGCASSSNNPWATPDSKPLPKAQPTAPAAATTETPSDVLFTEEAAVEEAPAVADVAASTQNEDLLADFPAIRRANLEKALKALKAASAVEELPMPEKGNARITRYNDLVGVIEFITPNTYAVGDHVVLTKENKAALVTVVEVDGNRVVADVAAGVKGAPVLKPADHVLCDIYRTLEELEKIAAEQRKAQREALAAARAAAQADADEDAAEEESEETTDEESEDEEVSDEESESEDEEEYSEDEEW
ncbi:MAG: hypothetical protein IKM45_04965 [Opitutales bacterium]|nr:hypothetical protein [Opitutales bacterium]